MAHSLSLDDWIAEGLAMGLTPSEVVDKLAGLPGLGLRTDLKRLSHDLEQGKPIADALAIHPRAGATLAAMTRGTDSPERMAASAAAYLRARSRSTDSRWRLLTAVAYPVIILTVYLYGFIWWLRKTPDDTAFEQFQILAEPTRQAINIGGYVAGGVVLLAILGFVARARLGHLFAWLPGVSSVVKLRRAASAAERVANVLRAGQDLKDGLELAARLPGCKSLRRSIARLDGGASPADSIKVSGSIGQLLYRSVALTAGRGDLAHSMERAAQEMTSAADHKEQASLTFLYTILMLVAALAVAGAYVLIFRDLAATGLEITP